MKSLLRGGVAVCLLLSTSAAWAQSDATRGAARDLGIEGVEDFQAGHYPSAAEKLGRAFEILRVPSLGLWSARALAKVGKLVEASERYLMVTRLDAGSGDVAVQKQAKADAASERDALLPRIPSLKLDVKGATATPSLTLDGVPLPSALIGVKQPANPGNHVIEVRDGQRKLKREVSLAEGQHLAVTLELSKGVELSPAESAAAQRPPSNSSDEPAASPSADSATKPGLPVGFWVGVGVTAAGVLTGSITAGLAAQKRSDLGCTGNVCPADKRDGVDSYNQLLTLSTIGFVAAGVGAATAGVFLLTKPSEPERARRFTPYVGLASAGITGTF